MKKINKPWIGILVAVITFASLFAFVGHNHFNRHGHNGCHNNGECTSEMNHTDCNNFNDRDDTVKYHTTLPAQLKLDTTIKTQDSTYKCNFLFFDTIP